MTPPATPPATAPTGNEELRWLTLSLTIVDDGEEDVGVEVAEGANESPPDGVFRLVKDGVPELGVESDPDGESNESESEEVGLVVAGGVVTGLVVVDDVVIGGATVVVVVVEDEGGGAGSSSVNV